MAKRSPRPTIQGILSSVPLRDLAYGFRYQTHYKIKGDQPTADSRYPLHNQTPIYTREQKVEGCRIPPWMLAKFASGEWKPSAATTAKIRNAYQRISYNRLREASIPIDQCRRLYKSDPDKVAEQIRIYSEHVDRVKQYIIEEGEFNDNPIDPKDAQVVAEWSVSMNQDPYEDFDDRYDETPS